MTQSSEKATLSSFFTIARFGPDSILIFCLLVVSTTLLYVYGLQYFAILTMATLIVILAVESTETINLSSPEQRILEGASCIVIRQIRRGENGVVKLYDAEGRLDSELWSAESSSEIEEGRVARVKGIRSIILQIEEIQ